MFTVAILTISDSGYEGARTDEAGPFIEAFLEEMGIFEISFKEICPDETEEIKKKLLAWTDCNRPVDLIVTTGGTGLSPRDVTPEATKAVIDREIPGMAEAMRLYGLKKTPRAMLSRAIVGTRGCTLIINLPGSIKAVQDGLEALKDVLEHAIMKTKGDMTPCGG